MYTIAVPKKDCDMKLQNHLTTMTMLPPPTTQITKQFEMEESLPLCEVRGRVGWPLQCYPFPEL